MTDLIEKKCVPCEGGIPRLSEGEIKNFLKELKDWQLVDTELSFIERQFNFKNYYQVIAFINAVAFIAHQQNHHPDLMVGYNQCKVRYTTHAIKGLTENDFICAAKINALLDK